MLIVYSIENHFNAIDPEHQSLSNVISYWQELIHPVSSGDVTHFPLDIPDLAFAQARPRDIHLVDWKQLLADKEDGHPVLSFAAEEDQAGDLDPRIYRCWDIDSLIARVPTLGVHLLGFSISYSPLFIDRITQNQRITFGDYQVHKTKQLLLGYGLLSGGAGYKCHVCFPHMIVADEAETHLTLKAQKEWVEHIVLPALRYTCPIDITQHHPLSFSDVQGKANVKQECFVTGAKQPINTRYTIPEEYLDPFWQRVVELSNRYNIPDSPWAGQFREPFLVVTGHGLKLFTKKDTVTEAASNYLLHLAHTFSFDPQDSGWDCWVDLGIEDTPKPVAEGVTLLAKTQCLDHWAQRFACPKSKADYITTTKYRWCATQDACSASIELLPQNVHRQRGLIAYNKAYNINKEMFATPLKGHNPFINSQLEALAYTQDLITKWYQFNSSAKNSPSQRLRAELISAYLVTKRRISEVLQAAVDHSFGMRQEYRISLRMLQTIAESPIEGNQSPSGSVTSKMTAVNFGSRSSREDSSLHSHSQPRESPIEGSQSPSSSVTSKLTAVNFGSSREESSLRSHSQPRDSANLSHRPYWILRTSTANRFFAAQVTRWMLLLELLICRSGPTFNGDSTLPQEQQLAHGVMVSMLLRVLRYSFNGDGRHMSAILHRTWAQRTRTQQDDNSIDDTNEENRLQPIGPYQKRKQYGLDLNTQIQRFGLPWLPRDLFLWNAEYVILSQAAGKKQAIARSAFQQSFQKSSNIQKKLELEDERFCRLQDLFNSPSRNAQIEGFKVAAQMVIREYVRDVISLLASRWDNGPASGRSQTRLWAFIAHTGLTDDEAAGFEGLTFKMARQMIGGEPRIIEVRPYSQNPRARNGISQFARYHTGLWADKVYGLFAFNDEEAGQRKRGWDNSSFRLLNQRLHKLILHTVGEPAALNYNRILKVTAAEKLWTILHYDIDKMSIMYKPSKSNSGSTFDIISNMTKLAKTNWIIPQVAIEFRDDIKWVQRRRRQLARLNGGSEIPQAELVGYLRGLSARHLHVYGCFDSILIFPSAREEVYSRREVQDVFLQSLKTFLEDDGDDSNIETE